MLRKGFVLVGLSIISAFYLAGCGGSPAALSVAITSSTAVVDGLNSVTLTATVTNDKTPGGMT